LSLLKLHLHQGHLYSSFIVEKSFFLLRAKGIYKYQELRQFVLV